MAANSISALVATALLAPLAAADPLGFYLGAGIGQGTLKADQVPNLGTLGFTRHHSAWQAMLGLRPIAPLGAELVYIDFGHASAAVNSSTGTGTATVSAKATALFAVGYLPLPIPLLDVYGKVGFSQLKTAANSSVPCLNCLVAGFQNFSTSHNDSSFAWGAGVQVKIPAASWSVRAEYEHFNASNGAPNLFSASLIWRL